MENTGKPKNAKKRPWWETINELKRMQQEKLGLVQTVGDRRDRVYAFIVAYKLQNDGNSPSVREILAGVVMSGYTPMLGWLPPERGASPRS